MYKFFPAFIVILILSSCAAHNGQLTGFVTYLPEGTSVNKPDSGAHVYLVKEGLIAEGQAKTLQDWMIIRNRGVNVLQLIDTLVADSIGIISRSETLKTLHHKNPDFDELDINARTSIKQGQVTLNTELDSLKKLGVNSKQDFFKKAKEAFSLIESIIAKPETIQVVADSTGAYLCEPGLGKFYVLIICNGIKEHTLYKKPLSTFTTIEIKPKEKTILNKNFSTEFTHCYECLSNDYYW